MKTTTRMAVMAALLALTAGTARAQLNGSGYYRVLNAETQRYLTVTNDNLGTSMAAAFTALVTVRGFDEIVDDPASILYLRNVSGDQYDLVAQGADSNELTGGYHFYITPNGDGTYKAYARYLTFVEYLGDNVKEGSTKSQADTDGTAQNWYILPLSLNANQYFGFKPSCQDRTDKYYTTCYASFPITLADNGLKAYYVDQIKGDYALMREIQGTIPAATPVIIKLKSRNTAENRISVPKTSPEAISDNILKGTYFDKTSNANPNFVQFDSKTMRLIGITDEGKVGFTTSQRYRVEANTAYLPVPEGSPTALTLITHEDYEAQFGPTTSDGDVNGDGKVNVGDIMAVINYMAGQTTGISKQKADVNGDNAVNVGDIMAIINSMASK